MAEKIKLSVIIFIILLLAAISFGAWSFLNFQTEKKLNITLQQNLDKLSQEAKKVEVKLRDTQKANADLDIKFQEANKKVNSLSQEIEKEKAARKDISDRADQLRDDLDKRNEEKANLEKKLESSQQETKALTDKINELNSKKKELEDKVKANSPTEQKVELGKIVVNPEPVQPKIITENKERPVSNPSVDSKVLVVNKEYNFVVINVGGKDGIAVGDVFSLSHNNRPIGDVKVEKVHDAMVAAGFLSPETKDKVSEGDKAVLKGK
jgi:hypothetical protein